jgi:ribosome biogenesis GTPase A
MKVCAIAVQSGHTKDLQSVQLERGLHIVDSPGVIFDDDDHIQGQKESSMLLRNIVKSEKMSMTQSPSHRLCNSSGTSLSTWHITTASRV